MSTIGWLALVVAGIALGFGIGRAWPSRKTKLAALEQERDQAHKELGSYREEVGAHFERTAELFDKVTTDYRSLYEHLALSARQLGAIQGEPAERVLKEPEQRRLGPAGATHAPLEAEAPVAEESAAEAPVAEKPAAEADDEPPVEHQAEAEPMAETPTEPRADETPETASPQRRDP